MKIKIDQKTIVYWIVAAVILNVIFFCVVYPETQRSESHNLARDFSAYYIGSWRLFHNPTQIYSGATQPGDYQILPKAQTFKYTPSFLALFTPFLTLNYQDALIAFNILQVALIPVLAFFVYKLVKDKNVIVGSAAAFLILVGPFPNPPVFFTTINLLNNTAFGLNIASFAPGYLIGYAVVNAHVLQTIILVGALYFGFAKKPWLSALLFAFGCMDPRAAIFALPLLLWYNKQKIKQFISGAAIFLATTNLPFFFYYNIGFSFLKTEVNGNIVSQWYGYDWLPLYAVATLMIVEVLSMGSKKHQKPTH